MRRPDQHVLEDRHVLEGLRDLEGAAYALATALMPGEVSDVLAFENYLSAIGVDGSSDQVEPGGLPSTVGADNT
jgi:hypothetical protein